MKNIYLFAIIITVLISCRPVKQELQTTINIYDTIFQLNASLETTPVFSEMNDDAADDPSIWVNHTNPAASRIIGTNKKRGICVYDLNGKELFFYPIGRANNIDVRYNFNLNGTLVDIVGSSNRTTNSITLMVIEPDSGSLKPISARLLASEVDEVYGFCLYHDQVENKHYAFVNGKNGMLEQWELFATPNQTIDGKIVRKMHVATQPEGMVADDELGNLYVGEEDKGIWQFSAKANGDSTKLLIPETDTLNRNIAFDMEGLAIYYASDHMGYLIASSQGNNSYAIFERSGNHKYLGSFSVLDGQIDGSEETDGLDVINASLGSNFPQGLFITQDGFNYEGDSLITQNFKLIPWERVASAIKPGLIIDTVFTLSN